MAGSRLDRIGTIFSRTGGLLKSGAMKYQDRPIWYDVYRVFPPKYEPYVERPALRTPEEVPNILYKEDSIRAKFFKTFGHNPDSRLRRLNDHTFEDASQDFVKKFQEVQAQNPSWDFDKVFQACREDYAASRPERIIEAAAAVRGTGRGRGHRDRDLADPDAEDESSISAEMMGRSRGKKPFKLITPESLRSLFEDAKKEQSEEDKEKDSTEKKS